MIFVRERAEERSILAVANIFSHLSFLRDLGIMRFPVIMPNVSSFKDVKVEKLQLALNQTLWNFNFFNLGGK